MFQVPINREKFGLGVIFCEHRFSVLVGIWQPDSPGYSLITTSTSPSHILLRRETGYPDVEDYLPPILPVGARGLCQYTSDRNGGDGAALAKMPKVPLPVSLRLHGVRQALPLTHRLTGVHSTSGNPGMRGPVA